MTNNEIRAGNIFGFTASRLTRRCRVCGVELSKNAMALAAHGKKHVREGTATPRWIESVVRGEGRTIYVAVEPNVCTCTSGVHDGLCMKGCRGVVYA